MTRHFYRIAASFYNSRQNGGSRRQAVTINGIKKRMTRRFVNPQKIGLLEHRRNVLDYKETTWEIRLCEQASILMVFLYFPLQEKRLIPTILNTIVPQNTMQSIVKEFVSCRQCLLTPHIFMTSAT